MRIQWSPPSTQQWLKQPVRSLANFFRRKKPGSLQKFLCNKRRELRKKRFEPEGSEKYKEVNNNKKCTKKAKENWIEEQCNETEENLRKNNSKRAYQLLKDLTIVKQGKVTTVQDHWGKCLTEERWTEYCSELYNHKVNGDPSALNCPQDNYPILCKEMEAAVQSLEKGKSSGINNIPAELSKQVART